MTAVVSLICLICALIIPDIDDILTIIGATTNPLVGFIIPCVLYLEVFKDISKTEKTKVISFLIITVIAAICIFGLFVYDKINGK